MAITKRILMPSIILLFILGVIYLYNFKENTMLVNASLNTDKLISNIEDLDSDRYYYFYLSFETLTTKNFIDTLSVLYNNDCEINELYSNNTIIKNEDLKEQLLVITNIQTNIEKTASSFFNYYEKILVDNNLDNIIENIYVNGIKIDKIKVNCTKEVMLDFLKNNSNVRYSFF